jgi:EAL and modified HD-GYP domain-containing signal transduction protein
LTATSELALVARQPIYDTGMAVAAYELLFRSSAQAVRATITDDREATLDVLANAMEIGLDRLTAGLPIHLNFPRSLLVTDAPIPLPADRVVIEVLENVPADADVLAGIAALRKRGHRIALDDYSPSETPRALLDVADIVKVQTRNRSRDQLASLVRSLKQRKLQVIAEEVETVEQFEECSELGFDQFQGYFLQHPQTFRSQRIPASRLGMVRLIAALNGPVDSFEEIEKLVAQDVSMPYRVLRCINSSYYNLPRRIDSIHQAIVILGIDNLKRLCTLVALQSFAERPPSLFANALVRARMCEQLAKLAGIKETGPFFITGLFSLLDVLTGIPIAELLGDLPLSKPIERGLVAEEGVIGSALSCVKAYERGAWSSINFEGLDSGLIRAAYVEAVFWADESRGMVAA